MRDVLVHRGPDDAGNYLDGPLGLGHRRLSIIDLSGGHQPMATPDGRFVICFNGEIYNYKELRHALERRGIEFRSHSDTEVILQLHALDGDDAVRRLNGIFAYALWDKHRHRLLLARDRAGIKPLYYCATPKGVAFASEIKALFKSGLITPGVNESRVAEYLLFRQVAGPETLFDGVMCLPPGHTVEAADGQLATPKMYWSIRETTAPFQGSYTEAIEALDKALNRAVARQLMSDVPLGTFCSGGIDSSLTTAIAAKHASGAINTFSVGFHEADFDESRYARMAATACNTVHHELRITETEFADYLPKLIWHHDLPLNFANSVHIYALSKLARQHVTVVLTGEGADELFGGYPRYYIPRVLGFLRRIPQPFRSAVTLAMANTPDHRLRKVAHYAKRTSDDALLLNSAGIDDRLVAKLVRTRDPLRLEYRQSCIDEARARGADEVTALADLDFQTYLVSILNRQDKMSMATSIEARVPFLDNEIIDLARSLPPGFKQTLKHRKRVLKDVALRYLPAEIVHRRKSGFGVPLSLWFARHGPLTQMLNEVIRANQTDLPSQPMLNALLKQHMSGLSDHSELLWGALNLLLWRDQHRA
jgi:asparagine synthase (glutamine-hydrolysing)